MRLGTLIKRDLARSKGRLAIVGAAVAAGVAVLVLLGALGLGLYRGVVEPLLPKLPLDLLKVEPRTVSLGFLAFDATQLSGGLDERALARIRGLEGVDAVYPVVGVGFPMRAEGGEGFLGRRMRTDIFATGISPELVRGDVAAGRTFEDPGPDAKRVPVLVAKRLLDLYNSTVATAIDKPRLSEEAVIGFQFQLELGSSYASGTPDPAKVERLVAEIVGFSDQATLVGLTLPEGVVRRWNTRHGKPESPVNGAYVKTKSPRDAGPVAAAIEQAGLKVDDTAKVVGAVLTITGVLYSLFALTLLALAAFAIAQTFFLLVGERREELAIFRAMGARRSDLRRLVLLEAGVVGTAGGLAGVAVGVTAALALDAIIIGMVPEIPFKPSHVISLDPMLLCVAFVLGVVAAVVGAFVPAARAATSNPASALRT
ncbi:FtsX-like permease family protein [Myxococcota bacterium]|nr:FtsX-like permease family protein [Myxococcota bacterium]